MNLVGQNNPKLMCCTIWSSNKTAFPKYLKNPRWQPAAILNFNIYTVLQTHTSLLKQFLAPISTNLVYLMSIIWQRYYLKWFFGGSHFELAAILNQAIFGSGSISKNACGTIREQITQKWRYCMIYYMTKTAFSKYLKNPRWRPAAILIWNCTHFSQLINY